MSALKTHAGELTLFPVGMRWRLIIRGPEVRGQVTGTRKACEDIAEAYAEMRRETERKDAE